ncbi:MAG TPA: response regulator [Chryseosolibacter sp.]|nr:response regulator [Chryseosolibacter sp.]
MNKPLHILLINDDPDDHEIFESVIELILPSARCSSVLSGQRAIEKLIDGSLRPHIIFLDLNMPLMNGKQFLLEVRNHPEIATIPVIVLTTSSDAGNVAETKQLGAKYFITKPDRFSQWEDALRQFFREQSFLTENR